MAHGFSFLLLTMLLVTSCASRTIPQGYGHPGTREVVIDRIAYDDKGLPLLSPPLARRPSKPGDRFTIARFWKDRPAISCDVVVADGPDLLRPLRIVYEWTGRGFQWGLEGTATLGNGFYQNTYNREEAVIALAIIATPLAAGTVGGFVVGVVGGLKQTVLEVGKALRPGEQVITCTAYDYDSRGRLALTRMLSADGKQELVRTSFLYEGESAVPSRTTVESRVEGEERRVR